MLNQVCGTKWVKCGQVGYIYLGELFRERLCDRKVKRLGERLRTKLIE
jgi:hypothetical protein